MKNVHLFSCLLFINITSQCMDQPDPWKIIDCSQATQALKDDCTTYLKSRLEEYKKIDFTPADMNHVNYICTQITGKANVLTYNNSHGIVDDKKNGFMHIAIIKNDLAIVNWMLNKKCWSCQPNAEGKEPIDLCIDKLLPNAQNISLSILLSNKQGAVEIDILDALITGYKAGGFCKAYREKFVTKLLTLELQTIKEHATTIVRDTWLTAFLTSKGIACGKYCPYKFAQPKPCASCFKLTQIYPTITDEDKNNFTHILVQKNLAEQLYDFIKKEYISFTPNSAGKNPLDVALKQFQAIDESQMTTPIGSTPARCCLFMLLNLVKKQQGITDLNQCCDKHTI